MRARRYSHQNVFYSVFYVCVFIIIIYMFVLSLFLKLHSLLFITGCTSGCICAMYIIAHIIHMHTTAVTLNKCFKWFAPRIPVALMYAAHAPSSTQNANVVPQNPIFSFIFFFSLFCVRLLSLSSKIFYYTFSLSLSDIYIYIYISAGVYIYTHTRCLCLRVSLWHAHSTSLSLSLSLSPCVWKSNEKRLLKSFFIFFFQFFFSLSRLQF